MAGRRDKGNIVRTQAENTALLYCVVKENNDAELLGETK